MTNDVIESRDFLLDFLRKEFVGPSETEEVLPGYLMPRHRYGAGILFPAKAEVSVQDEVVQDAGDDEPPVIDDSTENPPNDSIASVMGSVRSTEDTPESEYDLSLTNQFLPSAMGLSAVVDVPEVLVIKVSAATYTLNRFAEEGEGKNARRKEIGKWVRQPIKAEIELTSSDLVGASTRIIRRTVDGGEGKPSLELYILSRPRMNPERGQNERLITFTIVNRHAANGNGPSSSDCFYQCQFSVAASDGSPCFLKYEERPYDTQDRDELSLQLLYLHRKTFAVGHGCSADWESASADQAIMVRTEVMPHYEVKPILPTEIPGLNLGMLEFWSNSIGVITASCTQLAAEYEKWIEEQEQEIEARSDLSTELKDTAKSHLEDCRDCLRRIREGIQLLGRDADVELAFRLMNQAMLMQHMHYSISQDNRREWKNRTGRLVLESAFEPPDYQQSDRKWYPFQIAFILMNLKSVSDPHCAERDIVDVIWFPTGGGKTEAYLGLSAFVMFLRRLRNREHAGVTVLMRYTLRLLTTQQFQRAASLMCACEYIRRRDPERLGSERFSIGLWVGNAVTPNTEQDAIEAHRNLNRGRGVNQFILLSCPWCGAAMGPQQSGRTRMVKGYQRSSRRSQVRHICEDGACEFSSDEGLPVAVIDEQIYDSPPSILIGTVDKFALLAYYPQARSIFGIDTQYPPPELIIQDELHLISGPLGSMVGHYETVIDALCTTQFGESFIRPKIVGSTATISKADRQVASLYGRKAFLYPPQALKAGDSFFAEEREDQVGRIYTGVFATALTSHIISQTRTISALLQAPKMINSSSPELVDPYWTLMAYFNTLRELGHAATLINADIKDYLNVMWRRLDLKKNGNLDLRRFINNHQELTSRVQSNEVPAILQSLFVQYDEPDAVDICFATNMIQVGIDIPRLSLMTIVGQPKTTSEYIQASSRVGRDKPGIVVTNYNPSKSRDRSHYEHFRSYHQSIYQYVEPTSVTPFSVSVRERALHALIVILCRFWGDSEIRDNPSVPPSTELTESVRETILERVNSVDPDELAETERMIDGFIAKWQRVPRTIYGGFGEPTEEVPLMHPAGRQQHPFWDGEAKATPSSMRNVDADCSANVLVGGYGHSDDW